MTLRDVFLCASIIALGLTAELAYFWVRYDQAIQVATLSHDRQKDQIGLADEIAVSQKKTAEIARHFLATGDRSSLHQFRDVVAARGDPDPPIIHDGVPPAVQPDSPEPSLHHRISDADLANIEVSLLVFALAAANDAARQEARAINRRLSGTAVEPAPPGAIDISEMILESQAYKDSIATLTRTLNAVRSSITKRYELEFSRAKDELARVRYYVKLHFAALMIAMLAVFGFVAISVLHGFDRIRVALRAIANDEGNRVIAGLTRSDEVGEMARAVAMLRERLNERLARLIHLAYFDNLTGLSNRERIRRELDKLLRQHRMSGQQVATFMIDLDKFKEINDIYGHAAGDQVLVITASRLRAALPQEATIGRLGGDEFVVVMPFDQDRDAAAELAWAVAEALDMPIRVHDGVYVTCTGTVGAALSVDPEDTTDVMFNRADIALYRAKQTKRGTICLFAPGMDQEMRQRRRMEEDLRVALEREELALEYQPQVSSQTGEIVGFESLVRWNHPVRGRVSPSEFIPVAEEGRQILPIGRWTIAEACRFASSWTNPLRISVNLSPAQFYDGGLVQFIAETISDTGLPAHRLEVEVTEGVLIDDAKRAHSILNDLHDLGVQLALDDFGTGYSSLSYLRRFPFDRLKIDQSFVRALGDTSAAQQIVRAVISLAKALDMQVIAEGVETARERDTLIKEGCDELQGFLLGRPVGPTVALNQIQSGHRDMIFAFDHDLDADCGAVDPREERPASVPKDNKSA